MTAKVLMVQGTASSVGKSLLVAALCRIFSQDGLRVAPFKAQNMSLNSFVTPEGLEIGRAQAVQAEAAGIPPHVDMNPVLLKPEGEGRCQVVVLGRPWKSVEGIGSQGRGSFLWERVTSSLGRLRDRFDLVVIEGAGSPAEINLRKSDIVNMAVALHARSPVLLAGDIDRGGVFASLVGTLALVSDEERGLVKGFLINKFRGDLRLLEEGLRMLEDRTGVPVLGVIPYLADLAVAEEDSVALEGPAGAAAARGWDTDIAVIRFPRISNFDDYDALSLEPGVRLRYADSSRTLGRPAAVILPGTKHTAADLAWMRERGLDAAVLDLARAGTAVVGLCGGYQMLGRSIRDPLGVESPPGTDLPGLGLLPVRTEFGEAKTTRQASAACLSGPGFWAAAAGTAVVGYEIHMGRTEPDGGDARPAFRLADRDGVDGAVDASGRVWGTYLHGVFDGEAFRRSWLRSLGWAGAGGSLDLAARRRADYDRLAASVRRSVDMDRLRRIAGLA